MEEDEREEVAAPETPAPSVEERASQGGGGGGQIEANVQEEDEDGEQASYQSLGDVEAPTDLSALGPESRGACVACRTAKCWY